MFTIVSLFQQQNPFGTQGAGAQGTQSPFGGYNAFGASGQQGGQTTASPFGQAASGTSNLFGQQQSQQQVQMRFNIAIALFLSRSNIPI
jgi:hypothetical protein